MTTITVGNGQKYSTIAAAVAASSSGDTIDVNAGTYTNDVLVISHSLTLQAVGGTVKLVGTTQPANQKALIEEGAPGLNVSISGFDISGATVKDANGAAIRYEGGNLTLNNVNIHDNQNGILSAADPTGSITIANSTFANNGIGDGKTHNIYVGAIGSLTVKDSTITSAQVGHDIKSRAASTTITGNTITDGSTGTASYEIDLTNGGVGVIENNYIEKGANAQNPIAITFGEEGNVYANSSLTVKNNTIVNNFTTRNTTAVVNRTGATADISGNQLYGWSSIASGPANVGVNTTTTTKPAQSSQPASSLAQASTTPTSAVVSSVPPDAGSSTAAAVPAATVAVLPAATATVAPTATVAAPADTLAVNTAMPAATTDAAATAAPAADSPMISADTVGASPTAPTFLADTSASVSQSPVDSAGSMPASDMTGSMLADNTDPGSAMAEPAAMAKDWAVAADDLSGPDTSQYCSSQYQFDEGGLSAMTGFDATTHTSLQNA